MTEQADGEFLEILPPDCARWNGADDRQALDPNVAHPGAAIVLRVVRAPLVEN
jgi:hypothetical protein